MDVWVKFLFACLLLMMYAMWFLDLNWYGTLYLGGVFGAELMNVMLFAISGVDQE